MLCDHMEGQHIEHAVRSHGRPAYSLSTVSNVDSSEANVYPIVLYKVSGHIYSNFSRRSAASGGYVVKASGGYTSGHNKPVEPMNSELFTVVECRA